MIADEDFDIGGGNTFSRIYVSWQKVSPNGCVVDDNKNNDEIGDHKSFEKLVGDVRGAVRQMYFGIGEQEFDMNTALNSLVKDFEWANRDVLKRLMMITNSLFLDYGMEIDKEYLVDAVSFLLRVVSSGRNYYAFTQAIPKPVRKSIILAKSVGLDVFCRNGSKYGGTTKTWIFTSPDRSMSGWDILYFLAGDVVEYNGKRKGVGGQLLMGNTVYHSGKTPWIQWYMPQRAENEIVAIVKDRGGITQRNKKNMGSEVLIRKVERKYGIQEKSEKYDEFYLQQQEQIDYSKYNFDLLKIVKRKGPMKRITQRGRTGKIDKSEKIKETGENNG